MSIDIEELVIQRVISGMGQEETWTEDDYREAACRRIDGMRNTELLEYINYALGPVLEILS